MFAPELLLLTTAVKIDSGFFGEISEVWRKTVYITGEGQYGTCEICLYCLPDIAGPKSLPLFRIRMIMTVRAVLMHTVHFPFHPLTVFCSALSRLFVSQAYAYTAGESSVKCIFLPLPCSLKIEKLSPLQ